MLLGIPTYTVLRVFAREFFYGFKAVKKITSSLSEGSQDEGEHTSSVVEKSKGRAAAIRRRIRNKSKPQQNRE